MRVGGAPLVRARLERRVERRAACAIAGLAQRDRLGVRLTGGPMEAGTSVGTHDAAGKPLPKLDLIDAMVAAGNDRLFARLCHTLARPDLAENPLFVTNESRTRHAAALKDEIEAALADRAAADVLAALEALSTLNDLGIATKHPVEIVDWTNEEGSRFAPAMVGSGVFAGAFDLDYGLSRTGVDGVTLGEALERIGYAGDAPMGKRLAAYLEAHIEQGPILEGEAKTIGAPTAPPVNRGSPGTLTGLKRPSSSSTAISGSTQLPSPACAGPLRTVR